VRSDVMNHDDVWMKSFRKFAHSGYRTAMRKYAVFSPDGPARMLTHGGSVADVRGARILRTDYSFFLDGKTEHRQEYLWYSARPA
jgi:hypothetical protein